MVSRSLSLPPPPLSTRLTEADVIFTNDHPCRRSPSSSASFCPTVRASSFVLHQDLLPRRCGTKHPWTCSATTGHYSLVHMEFIQLNGVMLKPRLMLWRSWRKKTQANEDGYMTNEENIAVGLDEIPTSMSFTEGPSEGTSRANKKRNSGGFDDFFVEAMERASKLVAKKMEHSSSVLSKAIGLDITEKQMMIHGELEKLDGFTRLEKHKPVV